jgi:hypothetical protein
VLLNDGAEGGPVAVGLKRNAFNPKEVKSCWLCFSDMGATNSIQYHLVIAEHESDKS